MQLNTRETARQGAKQAVVDLLAMLSRCSSNSSSTAITWLRELTCLPSSVALYPSYSQEVLTSSCSLATIALRSKLGGERESL